jgi:hypothetical protein
MGLLFFVSQRLHGTSALWCSKGRSRLFLSWVLFWCSSKDLASGGLPSAIVWWRWYFHGWLLGRHFNLFFSIYSKNFHWVSLPL